MATALVKEMGIIKFNADIVSYKDLADYKCALTVKLRDARKQKTTYTLMKERLNTISFFARQGMKKI